MGKILGLTGTPLASEPVAAKVPDILKFITEEMVAVFLVRMPIRPTMENQGGGVSPIMQFLGAFKDEKSAKEFIRANHKNGIQYFLAKGICLG